MKETFKGICVVGFGVLSLMVLWWTWQLGSAYVEKKTAQPCKDEFLPAFGCRWPEQKKTQNPDKDWVCLCPKVDPMPSSSH